MSTQSCTSAFISLANHVEPSSAPVPMYSGMMPIWSLATTYVSRSESYSTKANMPASLFRKRGMPLMPSARLSR